MRVPLFFLMLLVNSLVSAQALDSLLNRYQLVSDSLELPSGSAIHYLLSASPPSDKSLPLVLFCQGSLPRPLLIRMGGQVAGVFPFNHYTHQDRYRFAILSPPGVPLFPEAAELDRSYAYQPGGKIPVEYLEQNTLPKLAARALAVLNHLQEQAWCSGEVIVVGHSQGARIAARIARQSSAVTHLAYLSCSPYGRPWQLLAKARFQPAAEGDHQASVQALSEQYEALLRAPLDSLDLWEKSERSFAVSLLPDLLALDKPLFVGYGGEDAESWLCDWLPLEFAQAGKTHLTHRPYAGLEHNFFELGGNGKPDYARFHWDEILADLLHWVETSPR